jgi:hypothetical protein
VTLLSLSDGKFEPHAMHCAAGGDSQLAGVQAADGGGAAAARRGARGERSAGCAAHGAALWPGRRVDAAARQELPEDGCVRAAWPRLPSLPSSMPNGKNFYCSTNVWTLDPVG